MGLFGNLFRPQAAFAMMLDGEGLAPVFDPGEAEVRNLIRGLELSGSSFASLTDSHGNYVQAAGSRPWCLVERRESKPLKHYRAFQDTPVPKYKDGAKIRTGAGDIEMRFDEWFLLKDAEEVFISFLLGHPFPPQVEWRSMNEVLKI
jgi:hypothetical protein